MIASQHWSFVRTNPSACETTNLAKVYKSGRAYYLKFQKVLNENNSMQLQGFLSFTNPQNIKTVQSLLGTKYSLVRANALSKETCTDSRHHLQGTWQYGTLECDPWTDGEWLDALSQTEMEELLTDHSEGDQLTESQLLDFIE